MPMRPRAALVPLAVVLALFALGCGMRPTQPAQPAPTLATTEATTPTVAATTAAAAPTSPAPTLVTMPNVVGVNAAVAEDQLKRLGFTNIQFGTVDGHSFVALPQNWTVKTQSAKAGTQVMSDTVVVLGCAKNQ